MSEAPDETAVRGQGEEGEEEVDEQELKRRQEEQEQAEEIGREALAKARAKLEFRQQNLQVTDRPGEDTLKRLDGSVKKNSAYVKKLRTLTEQQRASLTSDFKSLNLSKYIQEAATGIAEAKLKVGDVGCAVHLCGLLHQRYADFSHHLLEQLQKSYSGGIGKEEDKSAVTAKYRIGLRLLGELVLAGIIDTGIGTSLLMDMLTAVTKVDQVGGHPYLPVIVGFARHCAEDVAGIVPRKQRLLLDKYGIEPPVSELLPASQQEEFRGVLQQYFVSVRKHLVHEHKELHKRERKNRQILQSKGEISEERKTENEAAQKAYDKLLTNSSTLSDILDMDMPDLPEDQTPQEDSEISIELQFPVGIAEASEADPHSLWEDEDTRSFYERITDILPFVPAILFEGKKKSLSGSESSDTAVPDGGDLSAAEGGESAVSEGGDSTAVTEETEEDEEKVLEEVIRDTEQLTLEEEEEEEVDPTEEKGEEEKGGGGQGAEPGSPAALLEEFIARLPRLMNRKFVDEFAVEFCMSMNTKANRKKLARALFSVDKNRMDLVPFYARLVATLHPCLDDIAPTLVDMLMRDFRFQVRKKDQVHIHSKLKNVRFIAELTKFGLCPKPDTMRCITILLHDFTHHNLEMACLFIEHCGRYLVRSPDSHLRAKALLEIMVRKKKVQHLDGRQRSLVENALYYANPPETPRIVQVTRPPMMEYIRKLLYKDLNKLNTEKILRQFRKLPWNNPEVFQYAVNCLVQVWNIKFNNVHCVANLLAGLKPYQEDAVIRVVDGVMEDIRLGLELNVPKMNQRRVSGVKFLGELYNYQLVESNVIFRTLYMFLSFGCNPDGTPSPLDPYDSYFRVRLICIMLDTCGQYFDRGSSRKRLDTFLVFLQCYLFSKRQPLPLEVDHLVTDTVEALRPELQLFSTAQEAYETAMELEKKFRDKIGGWEQLSVQEGGEDSDEEEEEREGMKKDEGEEGEEGEEENGDDEPLEGLSQPEHTFEEEPVLKTASKFISSKEDDDFVSSLDKMMADDIQSRRSESVKVPIMDTAVPMHLKGGGVKSTHAEPLVHEDGELKMKFKLMTKKGNKQQLKELNVPLDSDIATTLRGTQETLKEEHREMKNLVLKFERRQEEEEYQAQVAAEHQQQQHERRVENQGTQHGRRVETQGTQHGRRQEGQGPQHGRRAESQGSQEGRRREGQGGHHSQQRRPPQQTGDGESPHVRERHYQQRGGGARRQHQHRQRHSDSHDRHH